MISCGVWRFTLPHIIYIYYMYKNRNNSNINNNNVTYVIYTYCSIRTYEWEHPDIKYIFNFCLLWFGYLWVQHSCFSRFARVSRNVALHVQWPIPILYRYIYIEHVYIYIVLNIVSDLSVCLQRLWNARAPIISSSEHIDLTIFFFIIIIVILYICCRTRLLFFFFVVK